MDIRPDPKTANVLDGGRPPVRTTWHLKIVGRCTRLRRLVSYTQTRTVKARKAIAGFSGDSRMRMLRFINEVDWERAGRAFFITLTYPDEIDHREYGLRSKDRYLFLRWMETKAQCLFGALWRVEWKIRKTGARVGTLFPHVHMLTTQLPACCAHDVRQGWRVAIGRHDGPLATDVKEVTGVEGAARYVSKYAAKTDPLDIPAYRNSGIKFGRHWGCTRANLFPLAATRYDGSIDGSVLNFVKHVAAMRLSGYDVDLSGGFTLFGDDTADRVSLELSRNDSPRGYVGGIIESDQGEYIPFPPLTASPNPG